MRKGWRRREDRSWERATDGSTCGRTWSDAEGERDVVKSWKTNLDIVLDEN